MTSCQLTMDTLAQKMRRVSDSVSKSRPNILAILKFFIVGKFLLRCVCKDIQESRKHLLALSGQNSILATKELYNIALEMREDAEVLLEIVRKERFPYFVISIYENVEDEWVNLVEDLAVSCDEDTANLVSELERII